MNADSADENPLTRALYDGLRELIDGEFPKTCSNCGRVYHTIAEFVAQTEPVPKGSGLKADDADEVDTYVQVFRNCACGSTLVTFARDRRDTSDKGEQRRAHFERVLALLQHHGFSPAEARVELLKVVHGGCSEAIDALVAHLHPE